jgi:hypothetical protein
MQLILFGATATSSFRHNDCDIKSAIALAQNRFTIEKHQN